jgi:hypothetical protein
MLEGGLIGFHPATADALLSRDRKGAVPAHFEKPENRSWNVRMMRDL